MASLATGEWRSWGQGRRTVDEEMAQAEARLLALTKCVMQGPATGQELEEEHCLVCLAALHDGDLLRELVCGHRFHDGCIRPWIEDKSSGCPLRCQALSFEADAPRQRASPSSCGASLRARAQLFSPAPGGGEGGGRQSRGATEAMREEAAMEPEVEHGLEGPHALEVRVEEV